MPKITVKNLSATYVDKAKNKFLALDNFNVEFENEQINVIVGENGCGKTTLLKCLCQHLKYEGDIFFDDVDIKKLDNRKLNIGYVTQNFSLYPKMTIFENIAFPLIIQRTHPDDINYLVRFIAEKFNITQCLTRLPKEISIGQQQRTAIARALVKQPAICFFDEPLTNLDKPLANEIRIILKKALTEFHCTTIYVTHDYVEAMTLADKIFVMNNSKVEICGTPSELNESNNETIKYLKESANIQKKQQ